MIKVLVQCRSSFDIHDVHGNTALAIAISKGCLEPATILMNAGAYIDAYSRDGDSALHYAADRMETNPEIFYWLLSAGVRHDLENNYGTTPLHVACISGSGSATATLLELGSEQICSELYGTPLYAAAENGQARIVELLLNIDANPDATGSGNVLGTAIMVAAADGSYESVRLLADRGAKLFIHGARFKSVDGTARAFKQWKLLELMGPEEDFDADLEDDVIVSVEDEDGALIDTRIECITRGWI